MPIYYGMATQQKSTHVFRYTPYLPVLGFIAGLGLWVIDTAMDVFLVHEDESFFEALWPHELTELWMRSLIVIVFTAGGFLGRFLVSRMEKLAAELLDHKVHLEDLVEERTHELEVQNQVLAALSTTDSLTGLFNRRHFHQVLTYEMDRFARTATPFSLIMLDIDHFKSINDTFGHNAGDVVLADIAYIFRDCIRKTDTFARWGGEEFLILLPDTRIDGAQILAEKLRSTCEQYNFEITQQVTISIGVVEYEASMTETKLLSRVDQALYFAKDRGRNRVEAA